MTTVTVSFTFNSIEDAITGMARLRAEGAPAPAAEGKPKAAVEPKAKPAPAPAAAATPPTAASKANGAAPSETATTLDYGPVGEAIKNGVAAGKRPEVLGVLESFGAKTGKDLKPEQYAPFMEKLTAALSAEDLG